MAQIQSSAVWHLEPRTRTKITLGKVHLAAVIEHRRFADASGTFEQPFTEAFRNSDTSCVRGVWVVAAPQQASTSSLRRSERVIRRLHAV